MPDIVFDRRTKEITDGGVYLYYEQDLGPGRRTIGTPNTGDPTP